MSVGTSIEWTHIPGTVPATMNALVGCRKVSAGCKICYAIGVANLRAGNPLQVMQEKFGGTVERTGAGLNWTGVVTLSEKALLEPLTRRTPTTYFVNSMSDLFCEWDPVTETGVPDEWIDRHYAVFALCPQHTFIVLTKRPERMQKYLSGCWPSAILPWMRKWQDAPEGFGAMLETRNGVLPNVWHLVSVEDQKSADERIPLLLQTPSAVRGVSCEPLLGPVDLETAWHGECALNGECWGDCKWCVAGHPPLHNCVAGRQTEEEWRKGRSGLDWVICGGESGAGARPMHPDWARGLRDQCKAAGVPFFFKQWGEWAPDKRPIVVADRRAAGEGYEMEDVSDFVIARVGKKAAGHLLDGREWHQFPEVTHASV